MVALLTFGAIGRGLGRLRVRLGGERHTAYDDDRPKLWHFLLWPCWAGVWCAVGNGFVAAYLGEPLAWVAMAGFVAGALATAILALLAISPIAPLVWPIWPVAFLVANAAAVRAIA